MKWFMLVLVLLGTFWAGWACCRQYKADQGFVQSEDGQEWRITRMQTFGMGEDYIAVYRKPE